MTKEIIIEILLSVVLAAILACISRMVSFWWVLPFALLTLGGLGYLEELFGWRWSKRRIWVLLVLFVVLSMVQVVSHRQAEQDTSRRLEAADRYARLSKYPIEVIKTEDAEVLIRDLREAGYTVVLKSPDILKKEGAVFMRTNVTLAIRIQSDMPVEPATEMIRIAKARWPRLSYVYLDDISPKIGSFIGNLGPVVAQSYGLRPLTETDFAKLTDAKQSLDAFHGLIRSFQEARAGDTQQPHGEATP